MLIWVVALHCEAKPVIDHYRLKKSARYRAFDLFHRDEMVCVISGIGKTCAAAACAWVAGLHQDSTPFRWINLGIAGGAHHDIGNLYRLRKIIEAGNGRAFHPPSVIHSDIETACCISLDVPSVDYHSSDLFDMEASAFFSTSVRFSSAELVQSLKIIGDNRAQPPQKDKSFITDLIYNQMVPIAGFAENLVNFKAGKSHA